MPQTKENILLDQADDEELLHLVELEVGELLLSYEFLGNNIPFFSSFALLALEALMANPNIKRGENRWVDKIYQRQTDLPFLLVVEDVFSWSWYHHHLSY
nr:TPA_asm: hypothetical protein HUJ06_025988 [Nelumbo nucifera]